MTAPTPLRCPAPVYWTVVAVAAALAAATVWSGRLALRAGGSGDFATVFAATRVWAAGGDPYDPAQIDQAYDDAGGARGVRPTARYTPSVYPPGTFVLVAPFAARPSWPTARAVWAGLDVTLILAMAAVLPRLAGLRWTDVRAPAVAAAMLVLGPSRAAVTMGQPVISVGALIVLSAWLADRRGWMAGLLMAVAVGLKPQMAGPFAGYFLLRRWWVAGGLPLVALAVLTIAGAGRMTAAGVPWLSHLTANVRAAAAPGAINDVTFHSESRFSMVNLQVLLDTVLNSPPAVTGLTVLVLGAAAVAFAIAVVRRRPAVDPLPARTAAELAFVAVWALLPVYHRWYDAEPLAMASAWAAAAAPARRWRAAAVAAVLLTVPFVASLALHLQRYRVTHRNPPVWEMLILPNQTWALCGLGGLLLWVLWRRLPATVERPMTETVAERRGRSPAWWVAAAIAGLLAASVVWGGRKAIEAGGSGDFTTVYAASRAWAFGHDPYDPDGLVREWFAADGSRFRVPNTTHTPSVYPPGTFAVVAPLAATLHWPATRAVWAATNLLLIAATLVALVSLAGLSWDDWRAPALVAAALALGPMRDGVIIGQPIVATTALIVLSVWAAARAWDVPAGVLLAVAVALKPPVAGPFALYYLLRRRWTVGGLGLVGGGLLTLVGGLRLTAAGVPWLAHFRRNVTAAELPGAVNDPTIHNPERFDMVNPHVLLHAFTNSRLLVTAAVLNFSAMLAVVFAVTIWRRHRPTRERPSAEAAGLPGRGLAELSFVAGWALLPVYHRWHDAAPLVLLLAWAATAVPVRRWRTAAVAAVALLVPFVVSLALHLPKPRAGTRASPLLDVVLRPNQCWAALLLCVLLMWVLDRRTSDNGEIRGTELAGQP